MSRQARRARHNRQVFGLAGAHRAARCPADLKLLDGPEWAAEEPGRVPNGRRFPAGGADPPIPPNQCYDGGRSCIPLRDSPGLSPGSLSRCIFTMPRSMPASSLTAFPDDASRPAAQLRLPGAGGTRSTAPGKAAVGWQQRRMLQLRAGLIANQLVLAGPGC
jgi:hypothetical protein